MKAIRKLGRRSILCLLVLVFAVGSHAGEQPRGVSGLFNLDTRELGPVVTSIQSQRGNHLISGMPGAANGFRFEGMIEWNDNNVGEVDRAARFRVNRQWFEATLEDVSPEQSRAIVTVADTFGTVQATNVLEVEATNRWGKVGTTVSEVYFYPPANLISQWFGVSPVWNVVGGNILDVTREMNVELWNFTNPAGVVRTSAGYGDAMRLRFDPNAGTFRGARTVSGNFDKSIQLSGVENITGGSIAGTGQLEVSMAGMEPTKPQGSLGFEISGRSGIGAPVSIMVDALFPPLAPAMQTLRRTPVVRNVINAFRLRAFLSGGGGTQATWSSDQGGCWLGANSVDVSLTLGVEAQSMVEALRAKVGIFAGGTGTPSAQVCPNLAFGGVTLRGYAGAFAEYLVFALREEVGWETTFGGGGGKDFQSFPQGDVARWEPLRDRLLPHGKSNRTLDAKARKSEASVFSHKSLSGSDGAIEETLLQNVNPVASPVLTNGVPSLVHFVALDIDKPWYAATDIGELRFDGSDWQIGLVTDDLLAEFSPATTMMPDRSLLAAWTRVGGDVSNAEGPEDMLPELEIVVAESSPIPSGNLLSENFEGATGLPHNGWTAVNLTGDAGNWKVSPGSITAGGDIRDPFVYVDSDLAGDSSTQNSHLTSPVFDARNMASVVLTFDHNFNRFSWSTWTVEATADGSNWEPVVGPSAFEVGTWDDKTILTSWREEVDLTGIVAGSSTAQIRFIYEGAWEWWWAVDNIQVVGVPERAPEDDWSAPVQLTNNTVVDRDPIPVGFGDRAGVLWIQNAGGEAPGTAAYGDRVMFAERVGGAWQAPVTLWQDDKGILEMDVAVDGDGEAHVVFAVDEDGDLETAEDRELYLLSTSGGAWQAATRLTDSGVEDSLPVLLAIGGDPMLVWRSGDNLLYTFLSSWNPRRVYTEQTLANEADTLAGVALGSGAAIAYTVQTGKGVDVVAAFYDAVGDVWSLPRQLTNDEHAESSISMAADGDDLLLAYVKTRTVREDIDVDIDGRIYTIPNVPQPSRSDLVMLRHTPGSDPAIATGSLSVDPAFPTPNSTAILSATVENRGDKPLNDVDVGFYIGNPNIGGTLIGSVTIDGMLLAGSATEVELPWVAPSVNQPAEVFVLVDPNHRLEDRYRDNNMDSALFMAPRIEVLTGMSEPLSETRVRIHTTLANTGNVPSGITETSFRLGSTDGEELHKELIPDIAVGGVEEINWIWDIADQDFDSRYVVVHAITQDDSLGISTQVQFGRLQGIPRVGRILDMLLGIIPPDLSEDLNEDGVLDSADMQRGLLDNP